MSLKRRLNLLALFMLISMPAYAFKEPEYIKLKDIDEQPEEPKGGGMYLTSGDSRIIYNTVTSDVSYYDRDDR